jgi:polyisoprenyl-phosphate glycosyltransferase
VRVSLVFPIFNEEAVLPTLLSRLDALVPTLPGTIEALFVNDGSRDRSWELLSEAAKTRPWMRLLQLSRNFGHQVAVTAGMHHAQGDAVVLLDADLQDPPELLPEMIRLWQEEKWDVVYGVRRTRAGESKFKLWTAALFYRGLRKLTNVDIPADTGDFRLMDRSVVDALNAMGEQHRFRAAGETKYPLRKMLKLAMDAVTAFSHAPLKFATNLGVGVAAFSILYGIFTILRYLLSAGRFEPGWSSLIVAVSLLSGVQLITLGLIGEYIGRIYDQVKGRPLYLISEKIGFEPPPE